MREVFSFLAIVLKEITRDMSCPLSDEQIYKLFPRSGRLEGLAVRDEVYYLIGLEYGSLHPQRHEKAVEKGDLWIWRSIFESWHHG